MARNSKFSKNTLFYQVFHSPEFADYQEALYPSRMIRSLLQIYPLRASRWLLGLDTTVLVDTLNCLSDRIRQKTEFYVPLGESSGVYPFVIGGRKPFVLLIPGGAYAEVCTLNEGFMMALALNRMGWNAFVCKYRVGKEAHFPNPQDDVADCLQWIFQNAAQMEVNTEDYAVCGFSASGHLAASWGAKALGYRKYALPRPKTIILAYPVITMGRKTHNLSRKNLLGDRQDDPEYQRLYSIENQVDAEYPDTFLWACEADKCVPFENTRLMAEALRKSGCRVEVRSYKGTAHGWGLAAGTPANGWLTQAIDFWQS